MYRNYIDKLVWYIPFKKIRDLIRNILLEYFRKLEVINEQIALLDFRSKIRNSISQLPENIIKETRNPRIIVTLTSYPERMETIDVVLYSLLDQTLKPDKIVLWLSYEEFPNLEDDVPSNILDMKKYGIEIDTAAAKNVREKDMRYEKDRKALFMWTGSRPPSGRLLCGY